MYCCYFQWIIFFPAGTDDLILKIFNGWVEFVGTSDTMGLVNILVKPDSFDAIILSRQKEDLVRVPKVQYR